MYRRILVPLDGSVFSEAALGAAVEMAERVDGEIALLIVRDVLTFAEAEELTAERDREAWEYIGNVAMRLKARTSVPVTSLVRRGSVASEIMAEARTSHDLIVMASHGRGGISRAWIGSVTDTCVRWSDRPVLVVRSAEGPSSESALRVGRVVVPLDGSDLAESAVPAAVELAKLFSTGIVLVRAVIPYAVPVTPETGWVSVDPRAEMEAAREYLDRVAERIRPEASLSVEVTLAQQPARTVCDVAGRDGLVVIASHGYGGIKRAVLGSTTDKVIRASEGGVLVVRPSRQRSRGTADRFGADRVAQLGDPEEIASHAHL
jgi:nucleotide-binding universal stress UspA family protein